MGELLFSTKAKNNVVQHRTAFVRSSFTFAWLILIFVYFLPINVLVNCLVEFTEIRSDTSSRLR